MYISLDKALKDCSNDTNCIGVQDFECNTGKVDFFFKCTVEPTMRFPPDYRECVYKKEETYGKLIFLVA